MTISLRAVGAATATGGAVTGVTAGVPAGLTATDLSILTVEIKGSGATAPTITTPTGWTLIGTVTNNGTAGAGTDTGSNTIGMYLRVGTYTAPTITTTGADSMGAGIVAYQTSLGGTWTTTTTTGSDTTSAANASITGAAHLSLAAGDWVIAGVGLSGDIGSVTAETLAATGATIGTRANRFNLGVTTGFDSRLLVSDWPVTAGTSTAAPVYTYTNTSSTTSHARFVRIREVAPPKVDTFVDDFASADTAKWTFDSSASTSGGDLVMTHQGSATIASALSKATYDLTASRVYIGPVTFPTDNGNEFYFAFGASSTINVPANIVEIILSTDQTYSRVRTTGGFTDEARAFNSTETKWLQFRESGGTLYFECAATEAELVSSPIVLRSLAAPFSLTSGNVQLLATNWSSPSSTTTTVGGVNTGTGGDVITGTGGLAAAAATVSAVGTVTGPVTGTSALTATAATLSGAATLKLNGTSALTGSAATVFGAGALQLTGPGTLTASSATAAGAGTVTGVVSGSGALAATPAALSGAGSLKLTGTSTLAAAAATLSGTASLQLTGGGAVAATAAALAAPGTVRTTGSGALAATPATITGSGAPKVNGAGTLAPSAATATGSATLKLTGSAALAAPPATITAAGALPDWNAAEPWNPADPWPGPHSTPTNGTGALTAPAAALGGAGSIRLTGGGGLTAAPATATGLGTLRIVGAAQLTAQAATLAGAALIGADTITLDPLTTPVHGAFTGDGVTVGTFADHAHAATFTGDGVTHSAFVSNGVGVGSFA